MKKTIKFLEADTAWANYKREFTESEENLKLDTTEKIIKSLEDNYAWENFEKEFKKHGLDATPARKEGLITAELD